MSEHGMANWRCPEPGCTDPTIVAFVCDGGCLELHADLEHWADGEPYMPKHHHTWAALVLHPPQDEGSTVDAREARVRAVCAALAGVEDYDAFMAIDDVGFRGYVAIIAERAVRAVEGYDHRGSS